MINELIKEFDYETRIKEKYIKLKKEEKYLQIKLKLKGEDQYTNLVVIVYKISKENLINYKSNIKETNSEKNVRSHKDNGINIIVIK